MTFCFCFHPTSGRFQEVGGQPAHGDPEKPDQSGPAQGMSVALFCFLVGMTIIEKNETKIIFHCVLMISPHLTVFTKYQHFSTDGNKRQVYSRLEIETTQDPFNAVKEHTLKLTY